eukprot:5980520-Pyramimonas_sp.AAC.1
MHGGRSSCLRVSSTALHTVHSSASFSTRQTAKSSTTRSHRWRAKPYTVPAPSRSTRAEPRATGPSPTMMLS